jgi:hypothetical protein
MPHQRIENGIFFNKEFVEKLVSLVPSKVLDYWKISVIDINRTEGWIRYNDQHEIDAIYIYVKTKFIEIDNRIQPSIIKFNAVEDVYTFYSIYSQYDPIEEKLISPAGENTYDSDLNIIAKHVFINNNPDIVSEVIPAVIQYKNGVKLKEYFITTVIFPFNQLNDLSNSGIITQKCKAERDISINLLGVYGSNIKYYYIG